MSFLFCDVSPFTMVNGVLSAVSRLILLSVCNCHPTSTLFQGILGSSSFFFLAYFINYQSRHILARHIYIHKIMKSRLPFSEENYTVYINHMFLEIFYAYIKNILMLTNKGMYSFPVVSKNKLPTN